MDKIVLKGLHFYGYHGVFPEETRKGQPFSVDVTLEFDASRAEETDSALYTARSRKSSKAIRISLLKK